MNTEVTVAVENAGEEKKATTCTECALVELGAVSEDTQGFGGPWLEAGVGRQP